MGCKFFFMLWLALVVSVLGQEIEEATIEKAEILDEAVYQQGKDTLVIQRIEQPESTKGDQDQGQVPALRKDDHETEKESEILTKTYIIAAQKYSEAATQLKIWDTRSGNQAAIEIWSNIDWAILQNLISLDGDGLKYQFILFHSAANHEAKLSEIPAELPAFKDGGARYFSSASEGAGLEATLDFLEAIHTLYDDGREGLKESHALQLEQAEERQRQVEKEAKKAKTRVLKMWRHTE